MYTARTTCVGAALSLLLLLALGPAACNDDDKSKSSLGTPTLPPTTEPTEDAGPKYADIEEAAAALAKLSGQHFRNFSTYDYGRRQDERCRSVIVRSEEDASTYPPKIRARLPLGLVCFVGTSDWRDGSDHAGGTEVVIGPGADQFDYMRLARTKGRGSGLETELLIRRMTDLNIEYGIQIVEAEADSVIFRWARPPWNYTKVSEDIYRICPDIISPFSEIASIEGLEAYLRHPKSTYVHLMWH